MLLLTALAGAPAAVGQLAPDARWRAFATEHFRVTFEDGLESTARRAAERAEYAYALLSRELVPPPGGRIELVVANNVDLANGYATPFPSNRIVLYAHSPVDEPTLSFTDDWLELLVLHELVHIFHQNHTEGIWDPLRTVFGRNPAFFPQIYAPGWLTEGLATYFESHLTGAGRVRGSYHEMVLRTAVLQDAFFSIGRATGDPTTWPGGSTRYIYGSLFFDYLARRFGPERLPELVEAVGRQWVPYRADAAARRAFGISFSRAWKEWRRDLRERYLALADSLRAAGVTEPEVLTLAGYGAAFPRFAPDGSSLAYVAATRRDQPAIRLLLPGGTERVLQERTTQGPAAWTRHEQRLIYGEINFVDPYRLLSDLHRVGPDGDGEQLTSGARLWEPDAHPDGRRVVAVGDAGGSNALELYDLRTDERRRITEPSPGVGWSLPRWSPAGDRIAAGRWRVGGYYDVVVLDSTGAVLRELTSDRAVDGAPAWSPDGRYVLFSSDRTGIPDLYAYDLTADRLLRVTRVLSGAFQPDVSPDGRWIAFSYYRADGFHIARIPFDPASWEPAPPVRPELETSPAAVDLAASAGGPVSRYSPWRSLAPTTWVPTLEQQSGLGLGVGAAVAGRDVVERHVWAAEALLYPDGARLEGGAGYQYRGWGLPVAELSLAQRWGVRSAAGTQLQGGGTLPTAVLVREREVAGGLSWLRRRWRSSSWLEVGGEARELEYVWDEPELAPDLRLTRLPLDLAAVLEAGYSSTRGYGFSLGPQDGFLAAGTLEGHRYATARANEQEPAGYLRLTGRGRAFRGLPFAGFAHHVLAVRLDAGAETGSRSPGFGVGGASGAAAPLPVDLEILGGGLRFPIRGYDAGVQQGSRAVSGSAEYRFPLWLAERGFRTVPLYLNRVWGDVFADVGAAWCPGACERELLRAPTEPRPLASVGAELMVEARAGFFIDLPFRLGVAMPLHEPARGSPVAYLRMGRSF